MPKIPITHMPIAKCSNIPMLCFTIQDSALISHIHCCQVAPIPRILSLQQGDSGKRPRDEGTTSDSEDLYSSHNSSQ